MKNIIKIFFNSIFIILFLFSVLIFISENTSTFNQRLLGSIEKKFLDSYNISTKIDSIKIKWEGIQS
jgi:nucleoside recognition membrane protein YjiH